MPFSANKITLLQMPLSRQPSSQAVDTNEPEVNFLSKSHSSHVFQVQGLRYVKQEVEPPTEWHLSCGSPRTIPVTREQTD